jgi:hypothetical protein
MPRVIEQRIFLIGLLSRRGFCRQKHAAADRAHQAGF